MALKKINIKDKAFLDKLIKVNINKSLGAVSKSKKNPSRDKELENPKPWKVGPVFKKRTLSEINRRTMRKAN